MKNIASFALRFSDSDWTAICGRADFHAAIESADFDLAEVIARRELDRNLSALPSLAVCVDSTPEHGAARAFVSAWAACVGKTGRAGKQSRQGHIRKLMRHGLGSDYARKMAAQAGLTI